MMAQGYRLNNLHFNFILLLCHFVVVFLCVYALLHVMLLYVLLLYIYTENKLINILEASNISLNFNVSTWPNLLINSNH